MIPMAENIIELVQKPDYKKLAIEKIAQELKDFEGDRYGQAVKNHVASTLTHFCEQDERFSEVVYKTKRTLSDCCREIMKGCGQYVSDIDVYRGAVRNYFPNADIDFHMTITLVGDAPTEAEMNREAEKPKSAAKSGKAAGYKAPRNKGSADNDAKTGTKKTASDQETNTPKAAAPKPVPETVPGKKRKKLDRSEMSDPNMIQLSLF